MPRKQYAEELRLATVTALIHLGIEPTRDWMTCIDIAAYAASKRSYSISTVVTGVC